MEENKISPRQLKVGEKYTWCMGAEPLKCEYIGHKHWPRLVYVFKLGLGTHRLSFKDVTDFIKPLSFLTED
jgi:hypothetical protein